MQCSLSTHGQRERNSAARSSLGSKNPECIPDKPLLAKYMMQWHRIMFSFPPHRRMVYLRKQSCFLGEAIKGSLRRWMLLGLCSMNCQGSQDLGSWWLEDGFHGEWSNYFDINKWSWLSGACDSTWETVPALAILYLSTMSRPFPLPMFRR